MSTVQIPVQDTENRPLSYAVSLRTLGLSTTEAINIFLHQVILAGGLPFEVKNPQYNAETIAAIQEARDIISGKVPAKSYNTVAELMEDLNSDDED